ncbi:hypothetical protein Verru16b_03199 [Lacunisphaera limnophila]|uniref:Pycsar effector protein domain-containing protein n=1 Tax=Lacunisphaera limnophila TaxID=1838286 RepID=A0A1D8AYX2_9BACT|nr:HAD family hydrolase [Lacunisphaera limnophila]AOS46103.1 hypothetical protein Verru16b_03199 [Lacunisphaera limnophila]
MQTSNQIRHLVWRFLSSLAERAFDRFREYFTLHFVLLSGVDKYRRKIYIHELYNQLDNHDGFIEPHFDTIVRGLDTVSHLSEHEDDKASRRLTAMAFMGALVGAFSTFALESASRGSWFSKYGPGMLILYYLFCVVGGLISLYTLLPKYNMGNTTSLKPRSTVFAPEIDRVTGANWVRPFMQNQRDQFREVVARQHLGEIKLISQITVWKMKLHTLAGYYFGFALMLFLVMTTVFGFEKMTPPPVLPPPVSEPIVTPSPEPIVKTVPNPIVIVFDADNTLWDTNSIYREAQLEMLSGVEALADHKVTGERLNYVRAIDQKIAESNPAGNRYPPWLLAECLYRGLMTEKKQEVDKLSEEVSACLQEIVATYLRRLNEKPRLLPQAKALLEKCAQKHAKLILLTESSLQRVHNLLLAHELTNFFHEVYSERNKQLVFGSIRESVDPILRQNCLFISVGDQLSSDLMPADKMGYKTVYIPAGFKKLNEDVSSFKPDYTFISLSGFMAHLDVIMPD